ncbi:hypothetical protein ACWD4L_43635 [Streptomyces sp. NPDC002596]
MVCDRLGPRRQAGVVTDLETEYVTAVCSSSVSITDYQYVGAGR